MTSRQNKTLSKKLVKFFYVEQPVKPKPKVIMPSIRESASLISLSPPGYNSQDCLFGLDEKISVSKSFNDVMAKLGVSPQRPRSSFATDEQFKNYELDYYVIQRDMKKLIDNVEHHKRLFH